MKQTRYVGDNSPPLPKKKTRSSGSFSRLLSKSDFDRESHSPHGENETNFHKNERYVGGDIIAQPLPTRVESLLIVEKREQKSKCKTPAFCVRVVLAVGGG